MSDDVLEGGSGGEPPEETRLVRGLRLGAVVTMGALLAWYAVQTGAGPTAAIHKAPGPELPGPPASSAGDAPVDALVSVAEGGFPRGTVLASIGPGREDRVTALNGTLLDPPSGVDPCRVPTGDSDGFGIVHKLWKAESSQPAVRGADLKGGPRRVAPFLQVLGYRGEWVWTSEGTAPGAPDSGVRLRHGIDATGKAPDDERDRARKPGSSPVALMDAAKGPGGRGTAVTGVVYADGRDPTVPRPQGYDLRVEWPDKRGAAFHVELVLGYGPDALLALDRPCDEGECGLTLLRANGRTAVVRQAVELPTGWTVPDPTATGRLAFTDDGVVLVVRTRDGLHTALAYVDTDTGRSRIVPGSEGVLLFGSKVVAAQGSDILFMVDGGDGGGRDDGRAWIAHWGSTSEGPARMLIGDGLERADRLVCAVPADR